MFINIMNKYDKFMRWSTYKIINNFVIEIS